jgi:hypothetical protein
LTHAQFDGFAACAVAFVLAHGRAGSGADEGATPNVNADFAVLHPLIMTKVREPSPSRRAIRIPSAAPSARVAECQRRDVPHSHGRCVGQDDGIHSVARRRRVVHFVGVALIAIGGVMPSVLAPFVADVPRSAIANFCGAACLFGWWLPIALGAAIIRSVRV